MKVYLKDESQAIPAENSTFKPKSAWNHSPALELFLTKFKEDILSVLPEHPKKFNFNRKEYLTMRRKMTTAS